MYKIRLGALLASASLLVHAQTSPPADGLVLWLKADSAVQLDGTNVFSWLDQSPNGNNAGPLSPDYGGTGVEAPGFVADAANGIGVVRFDGVDDVLEISNSPSFQPMDGSWTVLFVGRRLGAGQGDFPQVIGSRPWLAGNDKGWAVSLDETGLVTSHFADDATGHDVPATRSSTALSEGLEIWQVEEDRAEGTTSFYRRGDLDRMITTQMPVNPIDQFNPVHLGREIGGANNRRANIDLAEVLVYNRVLTDDERIAVTRYLADRFALPFTLNARPTVTLTEPAGPVTITLPATIEIAATAADPDGSIAKIEFYDGAALLATASQPPYELVLKPLAPGVLNISAVATDNRGERVSSDTRVVTVAGTAPEFAPVAGLRLWLKADEGLGTGADGVMVWQDGSGNANNATQADPAAQPELLSANDTPAGKPVLRFDGQDDFLDILNSESLQPGTNDWTVAFVARRLGGSQGDFPQVIGSRPWVAGLDKGWAVSFDSSGLVSSHFADGVAGHDVPATRSAAALSQDVFQVWEVVENRAAGETAFFLNGGLNFAAPRPMPTAPIDQIESIFIGREIGGADNRRANMELAEVMVFDHVLSATNRESLTAYLAGRYGIAASVVENDLPAVVITAPANGSVITLGSEVTISATASDSGAVAQVQFFAGSRLLGSVTNAANGVYSVSVSDLAAGAVTLVARAIDNLGATGSSASVVITNRPSETLKPIQVVGQVDYSDTFTVGESGEPSEANPRPNGMYNNDTANGYNVENTHGNVPAKWTPTANFSFNTPGNSTGAAITQAATGNDGAATGFAQSGGGDFSVAYGLRSNYVVQVDAILPLDRLDIGSYAAPGDPISAAQSLTIFFRRDSSANAGLALYNGSQETAVTNSAGQPIKIGIDDLNWHRFAVHFDQPARKLGLYVDGFLKANVDLATFAGGQYANFSNAAIGAGGAGFNGTHAQWLDNFMAGAPALVGVIDYADTFTVTDPPRRDGLYNDNSAGAYDVEQVNGNPAAVWTPTANFSFNTPGSSTGPDITQGATGNDGAATGFAQSGGGDFSFAYGLRENYLVSVDAILPLDRLDISSMPAPGSPISAAQSLTVFLRSDSSAAPGIALYNGTTETGLTDPNGNPAKTGVDDANWHSFAVSFDRAGARVLVFVDGNEKAAADLAEFAGGAYANFSNNAVGAGGAGFDGTHAQWFDNFMVGAPGPAAGAPAAGPARVTLAITRSANQWEISWTGGGTLELAETVFGPFSAVAGASSPYPVTPEGARKFFRVRTD